MKTIFTAALFSFATLCLTQNAFTQGPPPSPVFYHSRNSDEWVNHSIRIQKIYPRVLVVDASEHPDRKSVV